MSIGYSTRVNLANILHGNCQLHFIALKMSDREP